MSLAARLLNVFAVPGEVFEVVRASRVAVGNWVLPMILCAMIGALTAVAVVSQPTVQKQMRDRLDQQVKALEREVKAGKMKQAELDRTVTLTRMIIAQPTLQLLGAVVAAGLGVARVFWWGFVLWILGRLFLKVRLNYFKTLEVAGLGLMISVLGGVVTLLLMVNLPKLFAAPDLTSAITDLEGLQKSPLLLAASVLFSFWLVGVLAVGLSRLSRVPVLRTAWFVLLVWLLQETFLSLLGGVLGQFPF
jgi:hypothetical protein